MSDYTVYKHISPDGKVYIGITSKKPEYRWSNGKAYRRNPHFTRAVKKYGWDSFNHIIIAEGLTKEQAEDMEIYLIDRYDSTNQNKGYNIAKGGHSSSGYHHSEEVKRKISSSLMGVKHTPERRRNIGEASRKTWSNPEYAKKMSEVHIGKQRGVNHPMSKKVYQYDLKKNLIATFDSLGEVERILGLDHRQISACCMGKQKICHGFIWSYTKFD